MFENERHFARTHFEHGARALAACAGITKTGIEETGIVHAKLSDQGIERHHLGGVAWRHLHRFFRRENVELVGIEDQALVGARRHRLPEVEHAVAGAAFDIDQAGVALGAIADDAAGAERAGQIDADGDAVIHVGVVRIHQPLARVQFAQGDGVQLRMAVAETDLAQPRAFPHQDRKSARRNFGVQWPMIARLDAIEAAHFVGDDAGEDVEPSGRTFRIGRGRHIVRQRQAFQQRHDIDAAGFQDRAIGEREFVQLQFVDAPGHRGRAGQEAGAHAIGDIAQAQIETGGLDLVGLEFDRRQYPTVCGQLRDHPIWQNALVVQGEIECHGVFTLCLRGPI